MKGVISPGVSAGSKSDGAGVKWSAHVIWPAGASAWPSRAGTRTANSAADARTATRRRFIASPSGQRALDAVGRERQRAQARSGGVSDRVGDGGGGRPLRALAHAEEPLGGPVEQDHVDLRYLVEAQDRIVGPRPRGHARPVEAHGLLERPARRLDDPALDLVRDAVRV